MTHAESAAARKKVDEQLGALKLLSEQQCNYRKEQLAIVKPQRDQNGNRELSDAVIKKLHQTEQHEIGLRGADRVLEIEFETVLGLINASMKQLNV